MSNRAHVGDSNSLPSWISDHLGEKSYMEDEVIRLHSSPREDPSSPESSPSVALPLIEREEGETIMSTHPSEVAFYKVAFHAGLQLLIHPSIRMILHFYNICLAQLVPNTWRSVVCALVLWRYHKVALSLIEFRNVVKEIMFALKQCEHLVAAFA
ncbi:hypothetical protein Acr_08g0000830 [Actinidia rufa]|uniref:Transposase (putative) gypsy type domain-containing protein n=1 Tax=Actinidia rufa TaxID=165716 RepID=A0A7J0F1C5_9ERIC|nr:hypothetical protein Acr_08g0000830 [Actinidia rufa]